MKITMYELLGLVKDGKAPKKIKFRNEIYEYENHIKDSFMDYVRIEKETDERFYLSSYIGNNYISNIFTDEVEIIEESKKIEKIDFGTLNTQKEKNRAMKDAINKLIDEINNLKENDYNMKIARELFEELGWYLDIETNDNQIVYSKNKFNNDTFGFIGAKAITFDKEMESVYLDDVNDISMLLLQAINQQINELGWK